MGGGSDTKPPFSASPIPVDAACGQARWRPRSAEVKRAPDAAMPGDEVLPLLGADVGDVLPLLRADLGDMRADAHGCSLVEPAAARIDPSVAAHFGTASQVGARLYLRPEPGGCRVDAQDLHPREWKMNVCSVATRRQTPSSARSGPGLLQRSRHPIIDLALDLRALVTEPGDACASAGTRGVDRALDSRQL